MKFVSTVLLITGLILSGSALAHVGLSNSTPAKGAMLATPPSVLELTFSAPVRLVKLSLHDSNNKEIALTLPTSTQSQAQYSLGLPVLAASRYTVSWVIMGDDSHKMKGQFEFMVHASTAMSKVAAEMPIMQVNRS